MNRSPDRGENKLLRNRNFLLLTQGQLVNQAGTQISLAATAFWLTQSTDSASLVGLMSAVSALPLLLLGPLGGAVADRYRRRNLLIACDISCGLISCALALLLRARAPDIALLTLGLFAGNLFLSGAVAFASPALNALIPSVVGTAQIAPAMALAQASGFVALILGRALGGLLLTHFLPPVLYWVDAGTYFFSAGAESMVQGDARVRDDGETPRRGLFDDIRDGFVYVWGNRGMRTLLLMAIPINVLSTPVIVLLPFYTTNSLGQPLAHFGYLLAALSVGILAGSAIAGTAPPSAKHRHAALFGCVLCCAATILVLAFVPGVSGALIALVLLGASSGIVTLVALSVLIGQADEAKRGRVAAVLLMVTQGLTPLAMAVVGVVSDSLGNNIRLIFGGCGILLLVTVAATFSNRDLRDFLRSEVP